jgi:hypothetical protein
MASISIPKGNVWVGGNGKDDNHILKFTQSGKFLMQVGKPKASKGSNDTENMNRAAKLFVDGETNELYVADGYGNKRVIVLDADSGKYKRHWARTASGRMTPTWAPMTRKAPRPSSFGNPVHCADPGQGRAAVCVRPGQ